MCVRGSLLLFSSKQNFHCESPLKTKKISQMEYKTCSNIKLYIATIAKSGTEKNV